MKMKMRWKKKYIYTQPGYKEGNAKEEGASKHQHQHTWPEAGKPWKGKGKENGGRRRRKQNKTSGGGKTEAPEPIYHSETYADIGTHRTQPTYREGRTHEIGDHMGN